VTNFSTKATLIISSFVLFQIFALAQKKLYGYVSCTC
jgi:hypothetical protein